MSLFTVDQVKVEAACSSVVVWRDGFVLGCTNGTACTVTKQDGEWEAAPSSPATSQAPSATTEATSATSEASKLPQEDRMVAITDEGVTVFAVPSFAVKGQAFRTKGAAALCWHHEWQLLAVAKPGGIGKPNQVELYRFQGRELQCAWRCNTPEVVTCMLWLQGTLLCGGPLGLYTITVTVAPQCMGKMKEVVKWRQRCRCSLAATGATTATVFNEQTISYFRLSEGRLQAPWRWQPSMSGREVLEQSENRNEVLMRTPCSLLHWQPYMLLSGLPGQFQMHLATLEAAHIDLLTWNLPEAAEESDAMSMSSTSSHIGWGRAMRRAATAAGGVMMAGGAHHGAREPEGPAAGPNSSGVVEDDGGSSPDGRPKRPYSDAEPPVVAAARFGSKTIQVMALHSLEDQIDALVDMGKIREALALCEACGSAGKDFTDALRVALGVHLCDTGDLDIGLLEIASASKMYPLAILQYFPTLISNPEATLATMARKHMSAATRELLGFGVPLATPRTDLLTPLSGTLPYSTPPGPPRGPLPAVPSPGGLSEEPPLLESPLETPRLMSADGAAPPAPPHTTTHDQATPPTPSIEATGDAPHTTTNTAQPDTAPGGQQVDVAESPPASPPAASPPPSTGGQQQQQPGLQGASGGPAPAAIATTAAAGGDEDDDEEGFGMFGDWGGVVAANIAAEEASDADSDEGRGRKLEGVAVALPYLVTFRSRLLTLAAQQGRTAAELEEDMKAREVVDMALLHGWLQVADYGALLGLLTQVNAVPLSDGREALATQGLYVELIQLLQNHSHHPEALDVYRQLCEAPSALDPPPRGVAAGVTGRLAAGQSIGYLTRLCDDADAVPLICQSLESWLLKADPDGSVDLLLNRRPPIPPEEALAALRTAAPSLAFPYLEVALLNEIAAPEKFHTPLACMYLETLVSEVASRRSTPRVTPAQSQSFPQSAPPPSPAPPQASSPNLPEPSRPPSDTEPQYQSVPRKFVVQRIRGPIRNPAFAPKPAREFRSQARLSVAEALTEPESSVLSKLLKLIRESPHLDAAELQRHIPAHSTNKNVLIVKGAAHERRDQHEAAMHVYVHLMKDPALAEEFADRLYDTMKESRAGRSTPVNPATLGAFRRPPVATVTMIPGVKRPEDIYNWLLRTLLSTPEPPTTPTFSTPGSSSKSKLPPKTPLSPEASTSNSAGASTSKGTTYASGTSGSSNADGAAANAPNTLETQEQKLLEYAMVLLGRKWDRMDVAAALDCLPQDTHLNTFGPCISALSVNINRHGHTCTLNAALLNGYKHNLLRQQTQIDDKYAVVTPKSLCQHCNKRIGSQPALLTPDRKIMHEHCWQELEARRKAAEARGPGPILMGRPFGAPVPMPFPLPKW